MKGAMMNGMRILAAAAFLVLGAALPAHAAPAQLEDPHPKVRVETSIGNFTIALDRAHAPATVDNFLRYVREGHYDGMAFYRVVPRFVLQTGSYDAEGEYHAPAHGPIPLESGLPNLSGTVAMARADEPASAIAEWFINLVDNGALDAKPGAAPNTTGYAVFGTVSEGMDVVDRIARTPLGGTGPFGASAAPLTPVVIRKIKIVE
jgi:peptidyl-prolyl cis-trans isomerase B (cyclophilin B)